MDVLKPIRAGSRISSAGVWGFIVGRVLAAFGLGILAAQHFPRYAPS